MTHQPPLLEAGKKLRLLGKRKLPFGVGDSLLKVQKWLPKQARWPVKPLILWMLTVILIFMLYDIHDQEYMHQVVLDNVLNSRTRELIYALHKATTSYDAIQARELEKDIAYAELQMKCNEALLNQDKNLLVAVMRTEIETLQGLEMDALKQDRASVVAKVVPDAATNLIHSDEMGMLVVKLVKASIIYGWCAAFEEVAKLKEPFVMEKMDGYLPSSKEDYNQASDDFGECAISFFV
ncbi:hypothetical protein Tco_1377260 [Tanacetum coccineum]